MKVKAKHPSGSGDSTGSNVGSTVSVGGPGKLPDPPTNGAVVDLEKKVGIAYHECIAACVCCLM